jgi:dTDP-6-deoxy-L-talose 4-dehydrogenase (NAD+)
MSAGEQLRDFLAIETAAENLAAIVHKRDFNGVINCASGQPVSVRALVEKRLGERGASMDLNLGHYPYPTHEPLAFWAVVDRLQQLLEAQRTD